MIYTILDYNQEGKILGYFISEDKANEVIQNKYKQEFEYGNIGIGEIFVEM